MNDEQMMQGTQTPQCNSWWVGKGGLIAEGREIRCNLPGDHGILTSQEWHQWEDGGLQFGWAPKIEGDDEHGYRDVTVREPEMKQTPQQPQWKAADHGYGIQLENEETQEVLELHQGQRFSVPSWSQVQAVADRINRLEEALRVAKIALTHIVENAPSDLARAVASGALDAMSRETTTTLLSPSEAK